MAAASDERDSSAPWLREPKVEAAASSIEKTPQFGAALELFAECVGDALSAAFGVAFAGSIEGMETAGTFALLAEHEGRPVALMRSAALDARMAMVLDLRVVDVLIATMFGDDPSFDGALWEAAAPRRPRTELETRLIGELAKCLAAALRDAFAPVAHFDLGLESVTTLIDTNLLGSRDMPALSGQFTIKTSGGPFSLTVILPRALTAPLSGLFSRAPAPAARLDPNWTRRMEHRVSQADLTLTAILDEFEMTLGAVSTLEVGRVLPLSDDGQGRIRIECVERGVFICKLGERHSRYALEVEDIIAHPVEPAYPSAPL